MISFGIIALHNTLSGHLKIGSFQSTVTFTLHEAQIKVHQVSEKLLIVQKVNT
jgi:hypothetical protein